MRDVVVRIGQAHNRFTIVLRDYDSCACLNDKFLKALQEHLIEKYGDGAWKVDTLDYIEIL